MAEAKLDRNKAIYEEREAGVSFKELADKYGVAATCLKTIYNREKKKVELKDERYF